MPGFIVTCSRIVLLLPISSEDASPRYLRSCGSKPIEAKGKMRVPARRSLSARRSTTCEREAHPGTEHDMLADDAIRPDHDVVGQARARRDDRGGMDFRHR